MRTGFWWGNLEEGDTLEDPGVDGRMIPDRITALLLSVVAARPRGLTGLQSSLYRELTKLTMKCRVEECVEGDVGS